MFQGWEPKLNKKEKGILRANGMNSAVYLNGEKGSLIFDYSPNSFKRGATISLITLIAVIIYFIYFYMHKRPRAPIN